MAMYLETTEGWSKSCPTLLHSEGIGVALQKLLDFSDWVYFRSLPSTNPSPRIQLVEGMTEEWQCPLFKRTCGNLINASSAQAKWYCLRLWFMIYQDNFRRRFPTASLHCVFSFTHAQMSQYLWEFLWSSSDTGLEFQSAGGCYV